MMEPEMILFRVSVCSLYILIAVFICGMAWLASR